MVDAAELILSGELPESDGYSRILHAVAIGRTRPGEIADYARVAVERPLKRLTTLGRIAELRERVASCPRGSPRTATLANANGALLRRRASDKPRLTNKGIYLLGGDALIVANTDPSQRAARGDCLCADRPHDDAARAASRVALGPSAVDAR